MPAAQTGADHLGRGKRRHMQPGPARAKRGVLPPALAAIAGGIIGAAITWAAVHKPASATALTLPAPAAVPAAAPPRALSRFDLLAMSPQELAKVDLAEMNLICAEGLRGSEGLDRTALLARIEQWAVKVKKETERHLYRATDPKYAEHYHHSESYLRAELLIQTLQEDYGVRYNPGRIESPSFADSKETFIHGMFDPACGGTCASMPVLYAAVGRRLGYPIKLVSAREHLFCRWDDGKERFNIEGSSSGGWDSFPDDHYRTWPKPITQAQVDSGEFLKSMTPAEELACFLFTRGVNEATTGRTIEARADMAESHRLAPQQSESLHGLYTTFMQTARSAPRNIQDHQPANPPDPRFQQPVPTPRR